MFKLTSKGDYKKFTEYLKDLKKISQRDIMERYAKIGVSALASATPVDSGETANSWYYTISTGKDRSAITFNNRNINDGVPIAIILQYGHGTGTGGWVEGRDYINPAIRPIFDKISDDLWKEVTRL